MLCSGESAVMGSWKTMPMRRPRRARNSSLPGGRLARSRAGPGVSGSRKRMRPLVIRAARRRGSEWAGRVSQHIGAAGRTAEVVVVHGPFGTVTGTIGAELEILVFAEVLVGVSDMATDGDDPFAIGEDLDMAGAAGAG